jgi:Na+-transporting methylmalonyl-CoA/oxaloacetate decarboxylase gamma subunit
MYGWQAISAANGWMITLAGISIVFTGLLFLSILMANMERVLRLWDRRREFLSFRGKREPEPLAAPLAEPKQEQAKAVAAEKGIIHLSQEQQQVIDAFQLITNRIGEPFSLVQLLEKASQLGISSPHHYLDAFLRMNLIVEGEGELRGFYRWGREVRIVVNSSEEHMT